MQNFDSNILRDESRTNETGEVFTPTELVRDILVDTPMLREWKYLDPTCGNGQFIVEVMQQLTSHGNDCQFVVENCVYGVDLMLDNVKLCIYRLCVDSNATTIPGYEDDFAKAPNDVINPNKWKHNICCADAIEYDYKFIRYDPEIHHEKTRSSDGNFYLSYLEPQPVDNLFDW